MKSKSKQNATTAKPHELKSMRSFSTVARAVDSQGCACVCALFLLLPGRVRGMRPKAMLGWALGPEKTVVCIL